MARKDIKTCLLEKDVIVGEATGTHTGPPNDAVGQQGKIVNLYYDTYGDLRYTILVASTGKLVELYPSSFIINHPLI
jgi:hypothetical protein